MAENSGKQIVLTDEETDQFLNGPLTQIKRDGETIFLLDMQPPPADESDTITLRRSEFTAMLRLVMELKNYVTGDDATLERKDFLRTVASRILDDIGR